MVPFEQDNATISIEDLVSNALPEGEKTIEVTGVTSGASSQKKTPYVRVAFTVVEGEGEGKEANYDRYLSDKALPMLGRDLFNAGVRGVKLQRFTTQDPEAHAAAIAEQLAPMVGKRFKAAFKTKKDDRGVDKSEVRILGTADGYDLQVGGDASSAV